MIAQNNQLLSSLLITQVKLIKNTTASNCAGVVVEQVSQSFFNSKYLKKLPKHYFPQCLL